MSGSGWAGVTSGVLVRAGACEEVTLELGSPDKKEGALRICEGEQQVEGTADAKALRWECAWLARDSEIMRRGGEA